jgi:hypothetical protein
MTSAAKFENRGHAKAVRMQPNVEDVSQKNSGIQNPSIKKMKMQQGKLGTLPFSPCSLIRTGIALAKRGASPF